MVQKTTTTVKDGVATIASKISAEIYETIGPEAVREHYYNPERKYSVTPLPIWWFGILFIASVPVSVYSQLTNQNTLPASDPMGAFMMIVIGGSLIALTLAHTILFFHGKYVNSAYKIRSPVVTEN